MPKITFTDDELKNRLLFEMYKEEDGPNGPGFTRFGGFFREEALMDARETRRLYGIFQHYNRLHGDRMRMSDYLTFLASLFREIEDQGRPAPENPCAEVPLRGGIGDRLNCNIRPPDEILPPLATEHPMFDTERYKK